MARGQGESVRACVTRLAEGDRARMLRYQNKYRSILKNRPELLENIAQELRAEGKPCPTRIAYLRPYGETPNQASSLFEEVSLLSQEVGEDLLPLMLERMLGLLRRVREAESQAQGRGGDAAAQGKASRAANRDARRAGWPSPHGPGRGCIGGRGGRLRPGGASGLLRQGLEARRRRTACGCR